MAAKFVVVLVAMVAAGQCSVVPLAKVDTDYTSFAYDVADPNTGDYKSQVETRVGGNVAGQYSLLDSDGTKRTVDYTADDVNGFNAVVRKDPAVIATPVVAAAPAVVAARTIAAPVVATRTVAAPVVANTYAAPLVASAPAVYAAAPSVYASPYLARSVAAPAVYAAAPGYAYGTYGTYGRSFAYGSPLAYSTYSAPAVSYW